MKYHEWNRKKRIFFIVVNIDILTYRLIYDYVNKPGCYESAQFQKSLDRRRGSALRFLSANR